MLSHNYYLLFYLIYFYFNTSNRSKNISYQITYLYISYYCKLLCIDFLTILERKNLPTDNNS